MLGIACIEAILLTILVWSGLNFLRQSNEEQLIEHASTTATLFATTTKNAVLSTDLASLESFVQEILRNPGVLYARVMDNEVVLAEGGDPELLSRSFADDTKLENVRDLVFDTHAEIVESGIHFGRVEVGISTDRITEGMKKARNRAMAIAGIEMALTALFSFALGLYLTRQLKELRDASRKLADGSLEHRIQVRGRDELAQTSIAFNKMTAKLQANEQALILARDEAWQANQAKSDFLARMSHELRTPMNAIMGFTQILAFDTDEPLTPDQAMSVEEILAASKRLLGLINSLLDLDQITSTNPSFTLERVDAGQMIKNVLNELQAKASERHIKLRSVLPPQPIIITADRERLTQVLRELVNNAIRYNHDHGSVSLALETEIFDTLRIDISDTGTGMTQEEMLTIFDSFTRHAADKMAGGRGIGLSISKRIVELMGGTIGVESEPGEGSKFWIEIPTEPKLQNAGSNAL
ncbi:hybrid sensor histidine kinase/response regulator [bacterium endosymbiont of Escarpia laminata]|nr:MAG: hybrid sensor histidine kinase/response regulator [bacterium endosymbiont of Escarpia laminata]RLJ17488.1 MAG: hybrid sensor histidine kinase/response regulator [bacterium endosymbiont of Escarpia laminata]